MNRNPRKALVLVNLVFLVIIFFSVEVVLRMVGNIPGVVVQGYYDTPILGREKAPETQHYFKTNQLGLYVADPDSQAAWRGAHINSDGFRSVEFDDLDSTKPRLMFIGDSFLWGATTDHMDSSFANIVGRAGFNVLNFGIPGTDPDQYAKVAEIYLSKLKPDLVAIFFYMGNDVLMRQRNIGPFQDRYHITKEGWLDPFLDGDYLGDVEATYAYYHKRFQIPPGTFWNWFCSQTVIGTRIWQVMRRNLLLSVPFHPEVQARIDEQDAQRKIAEPSNTYLLKIRDLCVSAGIPFHLYVIPLHEKLGEDPVVMNSRVFEGMEPIQCEELSLSDFNPWPDGHFNHAGHRKFAEFILANLPAKLK